MNILNPSWLLLACALIAAYILLQIAHSKDDWHKLFKIEVLNYLSNSSSTTARRMPALIVASIAAFALANPSIPRNDSDTFTHAEGWFVIADLSRSMTLQDIAPTRLTAMRKTIQTIADQSQSRAVALVVFAGDAFMIIPPAFDKQHFEKHINLLEYGLVPTDGSNLTRGLSLVSSAIESSQVQNARLFILGDTGGFTAKAQAAVSQLTARNHRTDVIVFGNEASSSANVIFDLKTAEALAKAGQGVLLQSDVLGKVAIDDLDLAALTVSNNSLIKSGISLLRWQSLSHWVLLLAIPLLLLLFRRENQ